VQFKNAQDIGAGIDSGTVKNDTSIDNEKLKVAEAEAAAIKYSIKNKMVDNSGTIKYNEMEGKNEKIKRTDTVRERSSGNSQKGISTDNSANTQTIGQQNVQGLLNERIQSENLGKNSYVRNLNTTQFSSLRKKGLEYFEYAQATPTNFYNSLKSAKTILEYGEFVELHDINYYRSCKFLLLSKDGQSGLAVTQDGDIVSAFNTVKGRNAIKYLLPLAIKNGGIKLDNFNGALSEFYTQYGFVPKSRLEFNNDVNIAPKDWNYGRDGNPDIVFWVHNGDSVDTVINKIGNYEPHDLSKVKLFDKYAHGEMPISKWTKAAIIDKASDVYGILFDDYRDLEDLLATYTQQVLKDTFLIQTSWHHTDMMYSETAFYAIDDTLYDTKEELIEALEKTKSRLGWVKNFEKEKENKKEVAEALEI
jgi:hypothetical protein